MYPLPDRSQRDGSAVVETHYVRSSSSLTIFTAAPKVSKRGGIDDDVSRSSNRSPDCSLQRCSKCFTTALDPATHDETAECNIITDQLLYSRKKLSPLRRSL
mmetsp:Transcript_27771/g.32031  ORF Transcript_27771/g.32031 Transcript_27771/m.32031 type:complete len:102 (+) Transcript_27771:182-487(+)